MARRPVGLAPLPRTVADYKLATYEGNGGGCYLVARATDDTLWLFNWKNNAWTQLPGLPSEA